MDASRPPTSTSGRDHGDGQHPQTDHRAAELAEGQVQLGEALVAGAEPAEVVKPGEATLDDPALPPQPRPVLGLAARDLRLDPARPEFATVLVEVIATVGQESLGTLSRPPDLAADRFEAVDERQKLGDVVAIAAGQRDGQRDADGVGQQVVLGAGAGTIDRRGASRAPPSRARIWLPSTTAADQSIRPAAFSRRSSSW